MNGVVELEQRNQGILVLVLNLLCRFLESRKHGTLCTGEVLSGITVLTNLCEDLLHEDELIRHEGIVDYEINRSGVALDVKDGIVEGEEVTKDGIVLTVYLFESCFGRGILLQDTLLNNLVNGGGRERKSCLESCLNSRELISANTDDLVDCFLTRAYNPYLAHALATDLLGERLEVEKHIRVSSYVLSDLVDHEQEAEVSRLLAYIVIDVGNELCDGEFGCALIVEPILRIFLAHVENFHQCGNDELAVECGRFSLLNPRLAFLFLEDTTEGFGLALLVNVLFEHCNLEVVAVKAKVVIEHLRKYTKNCGLILVDRAFNIDVEKDGFGLTTSRTVNHHKGRRIVLKFGTESLNALYSLNLTVCKEVGKHLQEVRFTASKEARNPHTHISGGLIESIAVVVEEGNEVLLQLLGDDVFSNFLFDYIVA